MRSVPYLAGRLKAVQPPDEARIVGWIQELDSDEFLDRERAARSLEAMGEAALPALRKALAGRPTAEVRERAAGLLRKRMGAPGPDALRELRAVETLENAGTPAARRALAGLAAGWPEARLTREARASLARTAP